MIHLGKKGFSLSALCLLALAGLAGATGFLTLESSPSGAEVWYSGSEEVEKKYLGDTPLDNREMAVGKYQIWLILSSHDTLAIPDVFIAEGQVTQLNREIPTHYGYLEVNSDPDSSEIWLDGVRIGPSPYVNNLVLPAAYKLKVMPRESHLKNSARSLNMARGDSVRLSVQAPYRDKSFLQENLSIPAWRFQFEAGGEYRTSTGFYDNSAEKKKFSTQKADLPTQWDFPVTVRLGLPQDFETHLQLPFRSSRNPQDSIDSLDIFPSNMRMGVKYTYRPLNIGFDLTYGLGFKHSRSAYDHDYLGLTAIGAGSKGKIYGEAQVGYEFHFASKARNEFDPGDIGLLHAQVGYLLDPITPYLAASAMYHFDDDSSGVSQKNLGYWLVPEPGLIVDVADAFSLQFGVPFTIMGKNARSFWGIHMSLTLALSIF